MSHLARDERLALCDTFERVGPHAATLCSPWSTADLAAHLVIRDRRPDLAVGLLVRPLAARLAAGQEDYAHKPWLELVELVRAGPPSWSPARLPRIDDNVNLGELFIHHEDVLRAGAGAPQRTLGEPLQSALWAGLRRMGKLLFRRSATGVLLVAPQGRCAAHAPTQRGAVTLHGDPSELLLAGFGRMRVAEVEAQGSPEAVAALQESRLGFG